MGRPPRLAPAPTALCQLHRLVRPLVPTPHHTTTPTVKTPRQIVRLIAATIIDYASLEGMARRDLDAGKQREGCDAPGIHTPSRGIAQDPAQIWPAGRCSNARHSLGNPKKGGAAHFVKPTTPIAPCPRPGLSPRAALAQSAEHRG